MKTKQQINFRKKLRTLRKWTISMGRRFKSTGTNK